MRNGEVIAYAHIPKAGGTTLINFLRSVYGPLHIDVIDRFPSGHPNKRYRRRDLKIDLKLHVRPRSLAGHSLKPFEDFGDMNDRISWYTILRNPEMRCFSQYCQDIDLGRWPEDTLFAEWIEKGGNNSNRQVQQVAGQADAKAAMQVVKHKSVFVGLLEFLEETLCMLPNALDCPELNAASQAKPRNIRNSGGRYEKHLEREPDLQKQLTQHNEEDSKFYRMIVENVWPDQLKSFLSNRGAGQSSGHMWRGSYHRIMNRVHRNIFYKPFVSLDRRINRPECSSR